MKNELAPFKPMAKFLVVKSVVFFTFWQGVLIAVLVHLSVITENGDLKVGEVQVELQDFLVCVEMFVAAAVHKYTFGYETYANGTMQLLMTQRAMYLAEISYKRAQEEQKKAEEEEERLRAEKRKARGGKKRRKRKALPTDPDSEIPHVEETSLVDQVNIPSDNPHLLIDVDNDLGVNGEPTDESILEPDASVQKVNLLHSQSFRETSPEKFTKYTPVRSSSTFSLTRSSPSSSKNETSTPRSHSNFALNLLNNTATSIIRTSKNVVAPVTSFFVDEDEDCLFNEDETKPFVSELAVRVEQKQKEREERRNHPQ
jgi:hypothetical protein